MKAFCVLVTAAVLYAGSLAADGLEVNTYVTIEIEEVSGHDRSAWPVQIGIPVPDGADTDAFRLVSLETEGDEPASIPFQLLDIVEIERALAGRGYTVPQSSVEIAFLATLPGSSRTRYRFYFTSADDGERPAVELKEMLDVGQGRGLERVVDTGVARFYFDRRSGQLLSLGAAGDSYTAEFLSGGRRRPIHNNPDVWSPPNSWGHASGWNVLRPSSAPEFSEKDGPIMWNMQRSGEMPRAGGVETTVTYTAFAGMPFLLKSSSMKFTRSTPVIAVRNSQLVFNRGVHTHGVYIDYDGKISPFRAFEPENPGKLFSHISDVRLPPDIPFVGFFNDMRRYGVGIVTFDRYAHGNLSRTGVSDEAHFYFCDWGLHRDERNNFLYFTRAEVFNHNWNQWNTTVVPEGSVFAERSAILVFPLEGEENSADRFETLKHWTEMLRNPPRVMLLDAGRYDGIVPRIDSTVDIDGDFSQWEGLLSLKLGEEDDVFPARARQHWQGADDLSAELYLGWDDTWLYLAASVSDDRHFNSRSGDQIWNGDALQFAIRSPQYESVATYNMGLALTSGGVETFKWRGQDTGLLEKSRYTVRRYEEEQRTEYVIKMPLEYLRLKPEPGQVFEFNAVVFDDDDGEGIDYWMQLEPGLAGGGGTEWRLFMLGE